MISSIRSTAGSQRRDAGVVYVLMEVREETDYVLHHAQKILAIFAAMRAFAAGLRQAGHRVRYVTIDNASNRQSIPHNLDALMAHYRAGHLEYQAPDEWRLDEALQQWSAGQLFATRMVDSEHFLTARNEVAACFRAGSAWRMEAFYRRMRRQHRILLDAVGETGRRALELRSRQSCAVAGRPACAEGLARNARSQCAVAHDRSRRCAQFRCAECASPAMAT